MSRTASRETAMKLLYQLDFHKDQKEEQFDFYLEESKVNEKNKLYVRDIINGVEANQKFIDEQIENNSKGWKMNRISKVNIAILRLAIYELCFRNDIPVNVSINEAVELAKKFSSKDDSAFINGLLGKIKACEKNLSGNKEED